MKKELIFLLITSILVIPLVSSQLDISLLEKDDVPVLDFEELAAGGNTSFNQTLTSDLYLLLDASNDPITADLDINADLNVSGYSNATYGVFDKLAVGTNPSANTKSNIVYGDELYTLYGEKIDVDNFLEGYGVTKYTYGEDINAKANGTIIALDDFELPIPAESYLYGEKVYVNDDVDYYDDGLGLEIYGYSYGSLITNYFSGTLDTQGYGAYEQYGISGSVTGNMDSPYVYTNKYGVSFVVSGSATTSIGGRFIASQGNTTYGLYSSAGSGSLSNYGLYSTAYGTTAYPAWFDTISTPTTLQVNLDADNMELCFGESQDVCEYYDGADQVYDLQNNGDLIIQNGNVSVNGYKVQQEAVFILRAGCGYQTIPTSTWTRVNSTALCTESIDTHNIASSPLARVTITNETDGVWSVSGLATYVGIADNSKVITGLYKNGVLYALLGRGTVASASQDTAGFGGTAYVDLNAGDYIELYTWQNSASVENLYSTLASYVHFEGHLIAPDHTT